MLFWKGTITYSTVTPLLEQFPASISGTRIVARECLVDGPVTATSLTALFELRAQFLSERYQACTPAEYHRDVGNQFQQIQQLPEGATVHLWFEDDLFVRSTNGLYCIYFETGKIVLFMRYAPDHGSPYGFAAYTTTALEKLYTDKKPIPLPSLLCQLWPAYASTTMDLLKSLVQSLDTKQEHVKKAIQAHLDRLPSADNLGLPQETLKNIMEELKTDAFGPVFQAFQQKLPIYGFGDLQVNGCGRRCERTYELEIKLYFKL